MQNEKSYSQISIKLRYLYSIIMVLWNRCMKMIFEFVLNFNHWNIKSWIFNLMMKTIASLISMSYSNVCSRAQETTRWLWKQPSNYSFRWESPPKSHTWNEMMETCAFCSCCVYIFREFKKVKHQKRRW